MTAAELSFVIANTVACGVTCWYALCALNACTRRTAGLVRLSFATIAIGAFAAMIHPPEMDAAGTGALLVVCGLSAGFVSNRRRCGCLNCPVRDSRSKGRGHAHV